MKIAHILCFLLLISFTLQSQVIEGLLDLKAPLVTGVEPQPLLAQAKRISEALSYIGNPLPPETVEQLKVLSERSMDEQTVMAVQRLLDPFCLAVVEINPEARVKVQAGSAKPELLQEGWKTFLVKVHNQAQVTARLEVESPNAAPILHRSSSAPRVKEENVLSIGQVQNRFLEALMYEDRPLQPRLSGLELEYAVIQLYTRASGKREVQLAFNVGPGTQDIGFRNTVDILFDIQPSVKVKLNVKDHDGSSTMGSFIFMDGVDRFKSSDEDHPFPNDYRLLMAQEMDWERGSGKWLAVSEQKLSKEKKLRGIYPLPARRLAWADEYPDFFFQPQVYRADGEHVYLPPGEYTVVYTRGPEYLEQQKRIQVPKGTKEIEIDFQLKRWIQMTELGWYSGDHHIHAAGCSHYESPEEGVRPEHMWRQIQGEDLNFGSNLAWGPCWYYQKEYFTGEVHPLSNHRNLLRYDVEVSGFPSSHAGHLVLMNLTEDDYPNTTLIEEWPSWTLPVLQWAKKQDGVVGYAHSGWGLQPIEPTAELPNYVLPKMDGIGANEYVVTVTHDAVDLYSLGDTPPGWELNMWYHTLNCGFRVRASGETDFPCISDEKVGRARIYAELDEGLDFADFMKATKEGRSYVSTGEAHLIDFKVNDVLLGAQNSELHVAKGSKINISVKVAAFLEPEQDEVGAIIASRGPAQSPYWHVEKARVGQSRRVPVELIVNGRPVATQEIEADGDWQNLRFEYTLDRSSWIAVRILPAAHTNPIFVLADGEPIRDKQSAEWCLRAVDRCWEIKSKRFREAEINAAQRAYEHARKAYREIYDEAGN